MADFVFNIAKGRAIEMIADSPANCGIMLLKTAEAEETLKDRTTVEALTTAGGFGNVECDFTNYARKTALTGSVAVDNAPGNNFATADVADQTWTAAGGASNNNIVRAVVFYQNTAADTGRIPLTCHDFVVTTDGSDLTLQVNAAGFYRAA